MSERFEDILDLCLEQIRKGEADVASCSAKYPHLAKELKPLLETAIFLQGTPSPQPSAQAMQRGQARLLEAIQARKAPGRFSWLKAFMFGLAWRAAPVAAGLAAFLVIVVGAQAAGHSLPGDPLYPIKRASENARLVFARTPTERADLNLELAARRIDEVAQIVERGDVQQISKLTPAVAEHLRQVENVAKNEKQDEAVAAVSSKLEKSAIKQLARLQETLEKAPEEVKPALGEVLQKSGKEYASAIEAVASNAPALVAALGTASGTLQIIATDPPPPDVEQVLIQVDRIETNKAKGSGGAWVTLTETSVTFDLIKIVSAQKLLASLEVEEGTYTQIRMQVTKATVVAGGKQFEAKVPSEKLTFVRPFQVQKGETTKLIIDFDGAQSLHKTGNGEYILRPVVRLLVERPGSLTEQDKGKGETRGKDENRGKSEDKDRGKQPKVIEIEGTIQEVGQGQVVISNQRIKINSATQVQGNLQKGLHARVEVLVQQDGSFLAKGVVIEKVDNPDKSNKADNKADTTDKKDKSEQSNKGDKSGKDGKDSNTQDGSGRRK